MTQLTPKQIRGRFLEFFKKRGHIILPSASLIPENDPSVLFNTAGMQSLVPYLLGQTHPQGTRLANIQKCVRTVDIDEIGDNTHLTFFEMMGNWSLGDYGKREAIEWSYELLTNKDEGFGLDPQGMYVTCFEGDENAPRDEESAQIWKEIFDKNGVTGERIYFLSANKNWWSAGDNGPCGPDTEMFYDLTGTLRGGMTRDQYLQADDEQKIVEVWNDVFMEYLKKDGKVVGKLEKKNVDTGSGFERIVAVIEGKKSIYDTSLFDHLLLPIRHMDPLGGRSSRIIVDHVRASVFLISDGVLPSNTDRGYILRRLLRRAYIHAKKIDADLNDILNISRVLMGHVLYEGVYDFDQKKIEETISMEINKFRKTLEQGIHEEERLVAQNNGQLSAQIASMLSMSHGLPLDVAIEIAQDKKYKIEENIGVLYSEIVSKHRDLSRAGAEQKFKGGLAGTGEMETKYHTATHLLHQALRDILGDTVEQKGSNITSERLRFDFAFDRKMSDDEKQRVEDTINEKIKLRLPMNKITMSKAEAEKSGALHFFGDKYGDTVDVYYLGDTLETAYSKEFCGGPHVGNTSELKHFKIIKEEAVAAGIRRIKAVLE